MTESNNIAGPRQCGKTTWIVKQAAEKDLTIVTFNRGNVEHIKKMAANMGLKIRQPWTFGEFLGGRKGLGTSVKLIFDNAEFLLEKAVHRICGPAASYHGCTMTGKSMRSKKK